MPMIKVHEQMLKALLELLYKTNDCLAIKIAMAEINMEEYPPCDMGECDEAFCPCCNTKNLFKYLTDQWKFGEYDD